LTASSRTPALGADPGRRSFWLKHLHRWHWISAAGCLVGMLLFAITGFTLNHAADIEARPVITRQQATVPAELLPLLQAGPQTGKTTLPPALKSWLGGQFGIVLGGREAEWSEGELYVALARPGGDGFLTIDRVTGEAEHERTSRGAISYLNDLHKGRNTGQAWSLFLDLFAVTCLVFALTGLFLLYLHAGARPATWPMVALGLVLPLLLAILFVHS
jgi:hypothetical protein